MRKLRHVIRETFNGITFIKFIRIIVTSTDLQNIIVKMPCATQGSVRQEEVAIEGPLRVAGILAKRRMTKSPRDTSQTGSLA